MFRLLLKTFLFLVMLPLKAVGWFFKALKFGKWLIPIAAIFGITRALEKRGQAIEDGSLSQ